jgi:hypothetical protein
MKHSAGRRAVAPNPSAQAERQRQATRPGLAICTVALLTGAAYEYHHHAPDFLTAGGTQAELDALNAHLAPFILRKELPAQQNIAQAAI